MRKLFKTEFSKIKREMKTRYLAGEDVPSLAKHYGIAERTVYYHLGDLSPQDKGLHVQNKELRKIKVKQDGNAIKKPKRKEENKDEQQVQSQPAEGQEPEATAADSLADFIEG